MSKHILSARVRVPQALEQPAPAATFLPIPVSH